METDKVLALGVVLADMLKAEKLAEAGDARYFGHMRQARYALADMLAAPMGFPTAAGLVGSIRLSMAADERRARVEAERARILAGGL